MQVLFVASLLLICAGCRPGINSKLPEVTLRISPKTLAKFDYRMSESLESTQSKSIEQKEARFRLAVTGHAPGRIGFESYGLDERKTTPVKIAVDPFGRRLDGDSSKTLLGPAFPKSPVHVGSTWTDPLEDAEVIGSPLPTQGPTDITYTVTSLDNTRLSVEGDVQFVPKGAQPIINMEVHVSEDIDPRDGMPIRYTSTLKVWGKERSDISAATLSISRI